MNFMLNLGWKPPLAMWFENLTLGISIFEIAQGTVSGGKYQRYDYFLASQWVVASGVARRTTLWVHSSQSTCLETLILGKLTHS